MQKEILKDPASLAPASSVFIPLDEILSPGDSTSEFNFQRKLEDYQSMGIPEIWVVDPEDDSFSR